VVKRKKYMLFIVMLVFSAGALWSMPQAAQEEIILRFGGDVLLGGSYERAVGDDVSRAFRGFSGLSLADVSMVNLENPVTTRGTKVEKPYNFRMNPRYLQALKDAGIDLVTIANNHVFDYGREGLFDTIANLDSAGIRHVGAGRDAEEAYRPVVLEIKGRKIGFLSYYGGGEAPGATKTSCGVARRELSRIKKDIASLKKERGADYVVVNLHWGTEKARFPDESQKGFARSVIDAGADALIGHHPHVIQGIERYRKGVIVYSLGNFVFGGNSRNTYTTGIFEIRLGAGEPRYDFLPVGLTLWQAAMLSGVDSASVTSEVAKLSSVFPQSIFPK
jgi:poly-gamma-glutamate capsule biosynthesis protein CapA/YwtB (metallophosphatase superfamily)